MRLPRCVAVLALAAALAFHGASAWAQQPVPERTITTAEAVRPANTGANIAGGLLGAVLGMAVGIPLGNAADHARGYDSSCQDCTRWGAATGAALGSTAGVVLGVHAVNGGRGRFLPVLGRTSAAMAVVFGASFAAYKAGAPEGVDMLLIPAGVVVAAVIAGRAERATMPKPLPAPPTKASATSN